MRSLGIRIDLPLAYVCSCVCLLYDAGNIHACIDVNVLIP